MTDDNLFRLILLALFAIILPFGLYHRIRSHTGESLDRSQEGPFILFGTRLSGIPCLIGGIAWMINSQWIATFSVQLPVVLRWLALLLIGFGVFLLAWTFRNLGKNLTDTVVTRINHSLITTGPYKYVRHPFYLAGIVAIIGVGLVTANWFLLVSGLVPFGFLLVRTRIEEEKLVERFGDEYRNYMATTGKFWPKLR